MLLNNFFYIDQLTHEPGHIKALIRINESHEILKGHFPQQAVVPGVCVLEMLKEVLQQTLGQKFLLIESPVIKFLTMFTPDTTLSAHFAIDYKTEGDHQWIVTAQLSHEAIIFFKFKGTWSEQ